MENESKVKPAWKCEDCFESGLDDSGKPCKCPVGLTAGAELEREAEENKRMFGGKCKCAAPSRWENGDCRECRDHRLKKCFPVVFGGKPRGGGGGVVVRA